MGTFWLVSVMFLLNLMAVFGTYAPYPKQPISVPELGGSRPSKIFTGALNNLVGTNFAGSNRAGSNFAGNNLAGNNLAGNNLAGNNLAGNNLAGSNQAGGNQAGGDQAGSNQRIVRCPTSTAILTRTKFAFSTVTNRVHSAAETVITRYVTRSVAQPSYSSVTQTITAFREGTVKQEGEQIELTNYQLATNAFVDTQYRTVTQHRSHTDTVNNYVTLTETVPLQTLVTHHQTRYMTYVSSTTRIVTVTNVVTSTKIEPQTTTLTTLSTATVTERRPFRTTSVRDVFTTLTPETVTRTVTVCGQATVGITDSNTIVNVNEAASSAGSFNQQASSSAFGSSQQDLSSAFGSNQQASSSDFESTQAGSTFNSGDNFLDSLSREELAELNAISAQLGGGNIVKQFHEDGTVKFVSSGGPGGQTSISFGGSQGTSGSGQTSSSGQQEGSKAGTGSQGSQFQHTGGYSDRHHGRRVAY